MMEIFKYFQTLKHHNELRVVNLEPLFNISSFLFQDNFDIWNRS